MPFQERRIEFWFDEAKKICESDTDLFVIFHDCDEEFINFITHRMPIEARMSARSVLRYLYDSQCPGMNEELRPLITEFRDWFKDMRLMHQLSIYKKLKQNGNISYNREFEILARRFGKRWMKSEKQIIDAKIEGKVDHSVVINFVEKPKDDN